MTQQEEKKPNETSSQENQAKETENNEKVEPQSTEDQKKTQEESLTEEEKSEAPQEESKKPLDNKNEETPQQEEFDWDNIDADTDDYKPEEREKYQQLYDQTLSTIKEKEVVEGTVVSITKKEVVINIGYKSEGVVSKSEFRHNPDLKPGDKVEVYIESQEDKDGQLILSHKKARTLKAWERVNKAYENDEIIQGHIKCRTKGGMIVDAFGIETFLPGSQIDVKPIRDYDAYVGKTMDFKVVKINHEFKNVVVSHKAIIEEELEQQKK